MNTYPSIIFSSIIFIFLNLAHSLYACTVISSAGNGNVLAATNKDWDNTDTRILFLPSSENKFGRVYFGYQADSKMSAV